MQADSPQTVPLEVRLAGTTPPRGLVYCGDREPRSFEGWLALAAAVEAFAADEAPCLRAAPLGR
jgi:hypothetical protein